MGGGRYRKNLLIDWLTEALSQQQWRKAVRHARFF